MAISKKSLLGKGSSKSAKSTKSASAGSSKAPAANKLASAKLNMVVGKQTMNSLVTRF
ncbi:MAG TPA: hypothetical protein VND90_05970 [Terracidiphilus sp.]|nr:hypothetical protein [Terracidiphilus sp.]